ncbi:hypothetical protein P67b_00060 [Ruegeria phage Tedan]|nr:hypothetical protein P67b_00060 [Ruegeria phage Tedan]
MTPTDKLSAILDVLPTVDLRVGPADSNRERMLLAVVLRNANQTRPNAWIGQEVKRRLGGKSCRSGMVANLLAKARKEGIEVLPKLEVA